MRKIICIVFFVFISLSVFSIDVASIPVEFTSDKTHNIGFSYSLVSGSIEPSNVLENIEFVVSNDFQNYSTGPFYLFLQVFTPYRLKISIEATPLTSGTETLGYLNSASGSSSNFGEVSANGFTKNILFEEPDSANLKYPRTYNIEFNLNVPISQVSPGKDYESTLTLYLEAI